MVHREEAQALAQEAVREETDAQDGCGELLAELFHPLPPFQEGGARPSPSGVRRVPEVLLDGRDAQARLGHDDRIVYRHRLLEESPDRAAAEEGRLRPQREINRWQRRDYARPLRGSPAAYPLRDTAFHLLRETPP